MVLVPPGSTPADAARKRDESLGVRTGEAAGPAGDVAPAPGVLIQNLILGQGATEPAETPGGDETGGADSVLTEEERHRARVAVNTATPTASRAASLNAALAEDSSEDSTSGNTRGRYGSLPRSSGKGSGGDNPQTPDLNLDRRAAAAADAPTGQVWQNSSWTGQWWSRPSWGGHRWDGSSWSEYQPARQWGRHTERQQPWLEGNRGKGKGDGDGKNRRQKGAGKGRGGGYVIVEGSEYVPGHEPWNHATGIAAYATDYESTEAPLPPHPTQPGYQFNLVPPYAYMAEWAGGGRFPQRIAGLLEAFRRDAENMDQWNVESAQSWAFFKAEVSPETGEPRLRPLRQHVNRVTAGPRVADWEAERARQSMVAHEERVAEDEEDFNRRLKAVNAVIAARVASRLPFPQTARQTRQNREGSGSRSRTPTRCVRSASAGSTGRRGNAGSRTPFGEQ